MDIDTTGFTDKASKRPDERRLYEQADSYIEAYSKHTDLRIERDGPARAIGGMWEEYGPMQLEFLKSRGLKPEHKLLDIGCGTGRFARHAAPYLKANNYTGLDISEGALAHARHLAEAEGWTVNKPKFFHTADGSLKPVVRRKFDYLWMHSVWTHCPPEIIQAMMADMASMNFGQCFFTYKKRPAPLRTGLKQFGYPPEWFIEQAKAAGLKCEELGKIRQAKQPTMVIWRE